MPQAPSITYRYDDATENLLDQYAQQLAVQDTIFNHTHKGLNHHEYACARDADPILASILDVIAKIYEKAIPIAIIIDQPDIQIMDQLDNSPPTDGSKKH